MNRWRVRKRRGRWRVQRLVELLGVPVWITTGLTHPSYVSAIRTAHASAVRELGHEHQHDHGLAR